MREVRNVRQEERKDIGRDGRKEWEGEKGSRRTILGERYGEGERITRSVIHNRS